MQGVFLRRLEDVLLRLEDVLKTSLMAITIVLICICSKNEEHFTLTRV